jgi:integrating conjugative element protein (TIGR03746 family)
VSIAKTAFGQSQQELRFRNRIIGLLFLLLAFLGIGLWRIPTLFNVFVPPDLTRPQFVRPNEIPTSYVYAFAKLLMEALNYCPEDCARDYGRNLAGLRHFLTPSCYQDLAMHRERNGSLYEFRSRKLLPAGDEVFNPEKVTRLDHNVWEVRVEYLLEEHVKGVETRNRRYHYPVRVVRYDVPVERNPYQLAFDCYIPPGPRPVPENTP